MNSSQDRDFKNHMRDALSSFKIHNNELEKSKFEQKTKSLAIGGTQSNRESFDNSSFY